MHKHTFLVVIVKKYKMQVLTQLIQHAEICFPHHQRKQKSTFYNMKFQLQKIGVKNSIQFCRTRYFHGNGYGAFPEIYAKSYTLLEISSHID